MTSAQAKRAAGTGAATPTQASAGEVNTCTLAPLGACTDFWPDCVPALFALWLTKARQVLACRCNAGWEGANCHVSELQPHTPNVARPTPQKRPASPAPQPSPPPARPCHAAARPCHAAAVARYPGCLTLPACLCTFLLQVRVDKCRGVVCQNRGTCIEETG